MNKWQDITDTEVSRGRGWFNERTNWALTAVQKLWTSSRNTAANFWFMLRTWRDFAEALTKISLPVRRSGFDVTDTSFLGPKQSSGNGSRYRRRMPGARKVGYHWFPEVGRLWLTDRWP